MQKSTLITGKKYIQWQFSDDLIFISLVMINSLGNSTSPQKRTGYKTIIIYVLIPLSAVDISNN